MKICIAGKNNLATCCTEWLLNEKLVDKANLLVCFNKSDHGEDSFHKSFRKYANQNNLKTASLDELYPIENLIFFSLEYDRLIKPDKFSSQKLYNIHFSKLPKYKGMYTSVWPLLNGDIESGVTLHCIDEGIDTGDIIDQKSFSISDEDDCRALYFKYTKKGIELFKENFNKVYSGQIKPYKQESQNASYYSKTSIDFSNITINLNKTAYEIRNQIRAYNFAEYQIPKIFGHAITACSILETNHKTKKPGTILNESDKFIEISTVDYDIRLIKKSQQL